MAAFGLGPGNIDCEDVLRDIYLYLDDESDPELRNRIRQHLDGCSYCLKRYGLEQDVRSLIARSCGTEHAPPTLHERIRVQITRISVESTRLEYRVD